MSERAPGTSPRKVIPRQLARVGRRIAPSVTEVVTTQSRWLFDLARSRFQRCSLGQDHEQAVAFGSWQPYDDVEVVGDRVLLVRPQHAPPVRAELRVEPDETLSAPEQPPVP